jgi:hypothetical protein
VIDADSTGTAAHHQPTAVAVLTEICPPSDHSIGLICKGGDMKRSVPTIFGAVAAALLLSPAPAALQTVGSYQPGLGDLMTMTVQPRHIKLGIAGQQRNWLYAAYELHELQEAFDRLAAVWPEWQHFPVAQMIKFNLTVPFNVSDQGPPCSVFRG